MLRSERASASPERVQRAPDEAARDCSHVPRLHSSGGAVRAFCPTRPWRARLCAATCHHPAAIQACSLLHALSALTRHPPSVDAPRPCPISRSRAHALPATQLIALQQGVMSEYSQAAAAYSEYNSSSTGALAPLLARAIAHRRRAVALARAAGVSRVWSDTAQGTLVRPPARSQVSVRRVGTTRSWHLIPTTLSAAI